MTGTRGDGNADDADWGDKKGLGLEDWVVRGHVRVRGA